MGASCPKLCKLNILFHFYWVTIYGHTHNLTSFPVTSCYRNMQNTPFKRRLCLPPEGKFCNGKSRAIAQSNFLHIS